MLAIGTSAASPSHTLRGAGTSEVGGRPVSPVEGQTGAFEALRGSLRGAGICPKLGVDRKSPTEEQTGAFDPTATSIPVRHEGSAVYLPPDSLSHLVGAYRSRSHVSFLAMLNLFNPVETYPY